MVVEFYSNYYFKFIQKCWPADDSSIKSQNALCLQIKALRKFQGKIMAENATGYYNLYKLAL